MLESIVAYVNFYFKSNKTQFYDDNFIKACLVYQYLHIKYFFIFINILFINYLTSDIIADQTHQYYPIILYLISLFVNFGNITALDEVVFILSILRSNLKYLAI